MFFSVTGAHVWRCLDVFVYPFVGPGAHGQAVCTAGYGGGSISGRGWVTGQPQGCFGHLTLTCNECCQKKKNYKNINFCLVIAVINASFDR